LGRGADTNRAKRPRSSPGAHVFFSFFFFRFSFSVFSFSVAAGTGSSSWPDLRFERASAPCGMGGRSDAAAEGREGPPKGSRPAESEKTAGDPASTAAKHDAHSATEPRPVRSTYHPHGAGQFAAAPHLVTNAEPRSRRTEHHAETAKCDAMRCGAGAIVPSIHCGPAPLLLCRSLLLDGSSAPPPQKREEENPNSSSAPSAALALPIPPR